MGSKPLVSAVLLLAGLYYIALPHSMHLSTGLGLGLSHDSHMVLGAVLIVLAGMVYFMRDKKAPVSTAKPAARKAAARRARRR